MEKDMNVKDIIQKGEDVKYRVVIEHDGFDMSRDAFTAELQWGLRGESLVIEKSAMREMADGGYLLGCNTAEMCGQVYCHVSYDVPDSDLEDGYRTEVENVPIFYVVDGHRMPRVCKVGAYDGTHVTLTRVLKSGQSLPYAILADNTGAKLVTSDGYYLAVKTTKSDIMETYQLKQSGAEVQAILDANFLQSVTYAELVALRQSDGLIPGCKYRITDYECTTITPGTQSAGHQFDIVVQAIDVDTLSEDVEAMLHDGDTYFELCDLRRWELKYTVFNDVSRYAWADTENGKGVVYWMKDEFGNECGYDFKNIQFLRFNTWDDDQQKNIGYYAWTGVTEDLPGEGRIQVKDNTDRKFMYTFMRGGSERDASVPYAEMPSTVVLSVNCVIAENWLQPRYPLRLNNIVFLNQPRNVKIGAESYNSTVGGSGNVTIGTGFQGNIIGVSSHDFVIGNAFAGNYVGDLVVSTIGDTCYSNTIDKLSGCKVGTAFSWNILKECTECDFHNAVGYLSAEGNLHNVEVLTGVSSEQLQVEGNGYNVVGVDSNGVLKVWNPADLVS